jgi:hypothetical protein
LELKNYNAVMEILGGLNNIAVQRMKKTWNLVLDKCGPVWQELNTLMDNASNYKLYREHLAQTSPPCVPFLGE